MFPDGQLVENGITWAIIAASCFGAMLIIGAIAAMIIDHKRKTGQMSMPDHTTQDNVMQDGQTFNNPIYETID